MPNARVKLAKTGHGPHYSTLVCICVHLLFVLFYVLFVCKCVLPLGDNPIIVDKYIISNIYEKIILSQVGYLQELNRDGRSTTHKIILNHSSK
jgi:hypothetical protein